MKKHLLNSKQGWMRYITSIMLLLLITGFCSVIKAQTVTTDKPDYAPGETVVITGTGWLPGEQIIITIEHLFIHPGYIETLSPTFADGNGDFINEEYVIDESDLFETFGLIAKGERPEEKLQLFLRMPQV
jgi:hypothetical protein